MHIGDNSSPLLSTPQGNPVALKDAPSIFDGLKINGSHQWCDAGRSKRKSAVTNCNTLDWFSFSLFAMNFGLVDILVSELTLILWRQRCSYWLSVFAPCGEER